MIKEILTQYAETLDRPFIDRSSTVGASEIGRCARQTFYTKHDEQKDDDIENANGAATRGHLIERYFWTRAMRAHYGRKLVFAGRAQRTFTLGLLSATPDGLVIKQPRDALAAFGIEDIGDGRCFVVECKSVDPRLRLDDAQPQHVMQANTQLGLIRELTDYRPEFAIISYINASFLDDVVEFVIAFNERMYADAKARATKILTATSADELKPEGWIAGGKECDHCLFTRACGRIRRAVPSAPPPEPLNPQFIAEITDLAREAKARRTLKEAAEEDLREIEHQLKERLRAKGHRVVKSDSVSIIWSAVKGRPSFDMAGIRDAAARAGIELSEFETVGDATDRLVIRIETLGSN